MEDRYISPPHLPCISLHLPYASSPSYVATLRMEDRLRAAMAAAEGRQAGQPRSA